ncbi:MAG: S41 family peptidase, partial [Desulfobacteraceae bacterium]|nr:S41 family peptidase [Desulfobacteraceae bacterium]
MKPQKKSFLKKIILTSLLGVPLFTFVLWHQNGSSAATSPPGIYKNLELFANVLSIIQESYVEQVDSQKLIHGAIRGMLSTLDPHSSYLNPEEYQELQVETSGSFSGIGIEITLRDDVLTVVSPIEGTPAYAAGLKAGDKIIKIGDELTKDMDLTDAVRKLRGPQGSKITISVHRDGWRDLKEFTLTRDVIPIHSVKSRMLEPGFGLVRIASFQTKTSSDLKQALNDLGKKGKLKGLILDLRNNPGGLLDQAVQVADLFIDHGVIVSTKGRLKDQNMTFSAHDNGDRYNFPMVVLVNEGSASASEIVAGALKDHHRALILGAQTFGKGSVQTIIPLGEGSGLRLTTARYYTPNGTCIQAKGITPDIIVPTKIAENEDKAEPEATEPIQFLREKDLKHHISDGSDQQKKEDIICRWGQLAVLVWAGLPAESRDKSFDLPVNHEPTR